jgi:hypothetical protein
LLSCLMEENIMVPTQDSFDGKRFVLRILIMSHSDGYVDSCSQC